MSANDIVAFWGVHNLKRWSKTALASVAIPEACKAFLAEVGLPKTGNWTLRFDQEEDALPCLPTKKNYRVIGYDDPVPICLDELRGGMVIAVESDVEVRERFINSNVRCFAQSLVLYEGYRRLARSVGEEEILRAIARVEENMREADSKAFESPDNYWPVVIEQMNQGLL